METDSILWKSIHFATEAPSFPVLKTKGKKKKQKS